MLKALDRKVFLPSGGSLVIDRTEAMTVVDVNTGKYTGSGGNLEETVTRNNLEAAEEIVRQLRLRDLGGIIVIDFIDMVLESNRDLVLRRLTECLGRDRTKHQVAEVTSLGLVQMTRKRVGAGPAGGVQRDLRVLQGPRRDHPHRAGPGEAGAAAAGNGRRRIGSGAQRRPSEGGRRGRRQPQRRGAESDAPAEPAAAAGAVAAGRRRRRSPTEEADRQLRRSDGRHRSTIAATTGGGRDATRSRSSAPIASPRHDRRQRRRRTTDERAPATGPRPPGPAGGLVRRQADAGPWFGGCADRWRTLLKGAPSCAESLRACTAALRSGSGAAVGRPR